MFVKIHIIYHSKAAGFKWTIACERFSKIKQQLHFMRIISGKSHYQNSNKTIKTQSIS